MSLGTRCGGPRQPGRTRGSETDPAEALLLTRAEISERNQAQDRAHRVLGSEGHHPDREGLWEAGRPREEGAAPPPPVGPAPWLRAQSVLPGGLCPPPSQQGREGVPHAEVWPRLSFSSTRGAREEAAVPPKGSGELLPHQACVDCPLWVPARPCAGSMQWSEEVSLHQPKACDSPGSLRVS